METTKQEEARHLQPHIIILPGPGLGHLIPFTELAKRLALHHNFSITFIIPTDEDTPVEVRISLTVNRSLPSPRRALVGTNFSIGSSSCSCTRICALVVDLFSLSAIDVAKEFGIPSYVFYPTTATCFSLVLHMPELDKIYPGEYRDSPEPIELPGCFLLHGKDLMDPVQDRKGKAYKRLLQIRDRYNSAQGILINSFMDLEPGPIRALKVSRVLSLKPPVYPVGPLVQGSGIISSRGSVLFVSFGSGGTLSQKQLNELAFGLEMSEERFLWAVRSPNEFAAFCGRTKEKGLVVASWAPQIQVLSHGATGGFLTHCGWNSDLESIVHGVSLIAWPLLVKVGENGLVGKEEVARLAKGLIGGEEGKGLGLKMKDLKGAAARALRGDGSSVKALAEVAHRWSSSNVQK
ncbi:unnamed protein product [Coffea canephora]|uniref:UDP-glycosyltransferases domain-containing protein n=1 Tax=Coffea canephora TaxID=49390 RepID=A0A068UV17_COFCA|nr:unnamed protein product [Coffea canephora]